MSRRALPLALAALLALTACGALSGGELVLPEPENLEKMTVTAGALDLTVTDAGVIASFLAALKQPAARNTGRPSVQDVPGRGTGLTQFHFWFKGGGASVMFLYWEGGRLLLEQPYQGIYELSAPFAAWFRHWTAADGPTGRQA